MMLENSRASPIPPTLKRDLQDNWLRTIIMEVNHYVPRHYYINLRHADEKGIFYYILYVI